MRNHRYILFWVFLGLILHISCEKETPLPPKQTYPVNYESMPYDLALPDHFGEMEIPQFNPLTEEGVLLGRMLYYDEKVSSSGQLACASCHIQENSFSSADGVIPHINLGWSTRFLWKGDKELALEDMMLFEVEDFMNTNVDLMNESKEYRARFFQAFGDSTVTSKKMANALAQFVRALVSSNSKYDRYLQHEEALTPEELAGFEIFFTEKGDCFHCHGTFMLKDDDFHNNGLNSTFLDNDQGRYLVTGDTLDIGKFKTPTLRNIELTAPYMHDGSYQTLEEVVDFYSEGLVHSGTIDPLMKNVNDGGIHLTNEEKSHLIAFLKTFTDTSFVTEQSFATPF